MNWISLTSIEQLETIKQKSFVKPQVIFKHSTRCPISSMVLSRLENAEDFTLIDFNFLNLIQYRNLSNKISEDFKVVHQSPQILVIKNGECVYDESHNSIYIQDIVNASFKVFA